MRSDLPRRWLPPLAASSAAGLALGPLDPAVVGAGGLAAIWLLALVAALIGLPLGAAAARPLPPTRLGVTAGALTTFVLTLTASAALAAALLPLGVWAWALAPLPWLVAAGLGRSTASAALAAIAALALVGAGIGASIQPIGWTLLEPTWSAWPSWAGPAAMSGLLAALVGLGGGAIGIPPRRRAIGLALSLAAILGVALIWAGAYERDLSLTVAGVGAAVPLGLALAAPLFVGLRGDLPRHHAALGAVATAAWLGPGQAGLGVWWAALLPLSLAVVLALRAPLASGTARWALAAGALVAIGIAAIGWPALPPFGASLVVGLRPAAAVWVVGTRTLAWRTA